MAARPTIGILLDFEAEGSFSRRPHYAIRTVYFDAVWQAGGLPIAIPYVDDALSSYQQLCDGFLFPGGFYPFPSRLYGEPEQKGETVHPRYEFEEKLMRSVVEDDQPVLGICAGMQVLAGLYGGTFYRNLHQAIDTSVDHLNERPAEQTAHGVKVTAGSVLHDLLGRTDFDVNTAHNEALNNRPDGLSVNAVAPDGVVEGVEVSDKQFCLGVQWHPEFFAVEGDPNFNLFKGLVEAAGKHKE